MVQFNAVYLHLFFDAPKLSVLSSISQVQCLHVYVHIYGRLHSCLSAGSTTYKFNRFEFLVFQLQFSGTLRGFAGYTLNRL